MLNLINELYVQLLEAEYQASIAQDNRLVLHIVEVRALLVETDRETFNP